MLLGPPTPAGRAFLATDRIAWDSGWVPPPTITPLPDRAFGATVTDVDLWAVDDRQFDVLYRAWLAHGLLVFPGQHLSHDEQDAFAARFGDLEFAAAPLSNVRADGTMRPDDGSDDMMQVLIGNMGWHQDSTYMPVQAKGAVFAAEVVPSRGGATGFADTADAYDALEPGLRARAEGRVARHSLYHSQAAVGHDGHRGQTHYSGYGFHGGPVSVRPLVKTHPETGRKCLTIGRHAYGVDGLSDDDSNRLLTELLAVATRPERVHHHRWEPGDVVVWDNRRLLHQATPWPFEQPRVMWHTRIAGDPATESAQADRR